MVLNNSKACDLILGLLSLLNTLVGVGVVVVGVGVGVVGVGVRVGVVVVGVLIY